MAETERTHGLFSGPGTPPLDSPFVADGRRRDHDGASRGLTAGEVADRVAQGLLNADQSRVANDRDVVLRNTVTFFNVVLASLIVALLAVGEIRDGLFVGGVVFANVGIATLQELIATRRLRALQAITAPRATVVRDGEVIEIDASAIVRDDLVVLRPGDQVVADGRLEFGTVELDESLLTGESSTVPRSAGDEVRSGSFCAAGAGRYRAERVGAEAYARRLTAQARELVRRHTPLTQRFNRLMRVIFVVTGALAVALFIQFNIQDRGFGESLKATTATVTTVVPVGLLLGMTVVTAVGALRVSRAGAIIQDMHAVEALNYVDVIAFDKTGTITSNRLVLHEVVWAHGASEWHPWLVALADAAEGDSKTTAAMARALGPSTDTKVTGHVPFSSARRWSAIELERRGERRAFVLGAPEAVLERAEDDRGLADAYGQAAARGFRGVVFAAVGALPERDGALRGLEPLALVTFADELRPEVREAFDLMAALGIEPKVISGDNPATVVALLAQIGVEPRGEATSGLDLESLPAAEFSAAAERTTVFGRVDPALKARIVETLKANGHFVVMVGDGANDVHALRAADVGVAMASGTAMARGVAGIVLLRDSFTALIRGTREATFVLGNTGRLAKLFIAKSVYAYLLIFATNMLGLDFPFLPRQGGVMSTLTLGIPALFVAISVPPHSATRDFTASVLRFALPAGFALAASAIVLQFAVEGLLGRGIEEARTLVSLTIVIVGVAFVVEVLGLEDAKLRSPVRPVLTLVLGAALLLMLWWIVTEPVLRDFFAFTEVSVAGWVAVGVASVAALMTQYLLSRHWQRALDIVTAKPPPHEQPRGKAL